VDIGLRWPRGRLRGETQPAAALAIARPRGVAAVAVLRPLLWLVLMAMTAALLAYPRQMALEYSPIQSLDAVEPLPLFGALYYAWMAVLVSLFLLAEPGRAGRWQGLALVGMFVLVYKGFWDIPFAADRSVDSVLNAATVGYIRSVGEIPFGHPTITYTDFPGLHVLTATLAAATGLATSDAITVILLLMDLLLAGLLYLICLRLLEDPRWAGLAALLAMQGGIMFARLPFYPGTLGLVFASLFLLLALKQGEAVFARPSYALLATALLAATTVTHFVASTLLFFLLLGMWLVTYAQRGRRESFPSSTILLYAVVPAAWLIYTTVQTFGSLVHVSAEISGNLQRENFLRDVFMIGGSNFGAQVPLWATILKLFWLVLLFGAGTVTALFGLRRLRSLPSVEAKALGALLGILLLSVTVTLVSPGGEQFLRYPMYAPLVVAPLLLLAISRLPEGLRKVGLGAVVVSLVALAVPTFLAHYPTVRIDMFYTYEAAPAQMLSRYGDGTDLSLTAPAGGRAPYVAYLPNAQYAGTPLRTDLKDEDEVWAYLYDQVDNFVSGARNRVAVYVLSARPRVYFRHNFGFPPSDPHWDAIRSRLEGEAAIYDNGFVTLYEATSAAGVEKAQLTGH